MDPDFDALLALWPRSSVLARDIGVSYQTVRAWIRRGQVPVTYWPLLIDSARRFGLPGITAETLLRAAVSGQPPRQLLQQEP